MDDFECNFCKSKKSFVILDFGCQPPANSYLLAVPEDGEEEFFRLRLISCNKCNLIQVDRDIAAEDIFSEYDYFSSFSSSWLKHCKSFAEMMISKLNLSEQTLVLEIASNDGYLLRNFVQKGIPVLGIEPATNIAEHAKSLGVNTKNNFFTCELARKLCTEGVSAELIIVNNVVAHVPDINDFVGGIRFVLAENGIISFEFHHALSLFEHTQFDTIYHEHFSYLTLTVFNRILQAHGLKILDAELIPTHGGSLRVLATHSGSDLSINTGAVDKVLKDEQVLIKNAHQTYKTFKIKAQETKQQLIEFVKLAKKSGKTICGYGAAAKGNTFINYCGFNSNDIDFVVDKSPHKQGKRLPGSHIPILDQSSLEKFKPDYVMIFPWNLADEIIKEHEYIFNWSAKFVVAFPNLKVIDGCD